MASSSSQHFRERYVTARWRFVARHRSLRTGPSQRLRHVAYFWCVARGLSISRSIAQAHGGRLWARRNEDHGLTFYLLVPETSQPRNDTSATPMSDLFMGGIP